MLYHKYHDETTTQYLENSLTVQGWSAQDIRENRETECQKANTTGAIMISFSEYISEEVAEPSIKTQFEVPEHNISFLEQKIAKLNKAAAKLKVDPITIVKGTPYAKEIRSITKPNAPHINISYEDIISPM